MSISKDKIILEGFIKKKSPKAFLGRHAWQARYFVLWEHQLCYYKRKEDTDDESKCLGFLLVENMSGVIVMKDKSVGRFNVVLEGVDRQFELLADNDVEMKQWVDSIQAALKKYGKRPISLAPNMTPSGTTASEAKFWKPKIHQKILKERRQAISAETGSLKFDPQTLASRIYDKSDATRSLILRAIKKSLAFRIMDDKDLLETVSLMWQETYSQGDVVLYEHRPAHIFYVIVQGSFAALSSTISNSSNTSSSSMSTPPPPPPPPPPSSSSNNNSRTSSIVSSPMHGTVPNNNNSGIPAHNKSLSVNITAELDNYNSHPATPMSPDSTTSYTLPSGAKSGILAAGECFGELALLYDSVATHTVTALENSVCFAIDRAQYKRLIAAASQKRFISRVNFLKTTSLLSQLPETLIKQIAEALEERQYESGDVIIKQGEPGDAFYIVQSGEAEASRDGVVVHHYQHQGEYFGERALIKNEQRGATITALTPVSVLYLTRRDFVALMGRMEETLVHGVRKYSILNRELNDVPTHDVSAYMQDNHDGVSSSGANTGTIPPPPPPPPSNTTGNNMTDGLPPIPTMSALQSNNNNNTTVTNGGVPSLRTLRIHSNVTNNVSSDVNVSHNNGLNGIPTISSLSNDQSLPPTLPTFADIASQSEPTTITLPTTITTTPNESASLKLNDLRVVGTLGRGTFGHVQLVADKHEQTYALKAVNKAHVMKHNQIPHILNERAVMLELNHPFIVRLYTTMRDKNFLYFLLEPSLGGELFSLLRQNDRFDNDTSRFYAAIVISVFQYMHSKDILYRDLKPENLLMDSDGYIKVTDFGFAKKTKDRTYTFCGTPDYLAPEIVASAGHHTGADWWTVGILIYEMLAGFTPFYDDAGPTQMYSKILAGKLSFPHFVSPAAQNLIASLLQTKPTRRLGVLLGGADVIKKHSWFDGFDWNALHKREIKAPIHINIKDKYDLSNFDVYPDEDLEDDDYVLDPNNPDWDTVF